MQAMFETANRRGSNINYIILVLQCVQTISCVYMSTINKLIKL